MENRKEDSEIFEMIRKPTVELCMDQVLNNKILEIELRKEENEPDSYVQLENAKPPISDSNVTQMGTELGWKPQMLQHSETQNNLTDWNAQAPNQG